MRRDADAAMGDGLPLAERLEAKFELKQFLEEIAGLQHSTNRCDGVGGQMHHQLLAPPFEPEPLQQHEETADVVLSLPGCGFGGSVTTRFLQAAKADFSVSGSSGPTGASK